MCGCNKQGVRIVENCRTAKEQRKTRCSKTREHTTPTWLTLIMYASTVDGKRVTVLDSILTCAHIREVQ
uniref:Uncharacterized protein n=1 Tax=Arion vulgaris TaxID=1028688 RepID=A0A0B6YXS3_9EUPU